MHEFFLKPIAHRGLHDKAEGIIENSPTAFRLAAEKGYAIECDLQLSADNVPMVIHDSTLERVTGQQGRIDTLSAGQIEHIALKDSRDSDHTLRFSDFLALVDGRVALAVEIKPQDDGRNKALSEAVARDLRAYSGQVALMSFHPDILCFVRKYGFKGPVGILVERFVSEEAQRHVGPWRRFLMRHLLHYPWTRFDFIDCDHRALDLPAVRLFRALGFLVTCWTIKSQPEAEAALKHSDQITFEGFTPARG